MKEPWYEWAYKTKPYLHKARLMKYRFCNEGQPNHKHCEICFDRFSNCKEDLTEGYITKDQKSVICCACYWELKDFFGFAVEESP